MDGWMLWMTCSYNVLHSMKLAFSCAPLRKKVVNDFITKRNFLLRIIFKSRIFECSYVNENLMLRNLVCLRLEHFWYLRDFSGTILTFNIYSSRQKKLNWKITIKINLKNNGQKNFKPTVKILTWKITVKINLKK